jgi:hypothetical protein
MQGALPGSFLSRCDMGAPAHQMASWRYLETFPPDALSEALRLFFLDFPESGLGIYYVPNPGELVSSTAGLNGSANGRPCTHWSDLCLSED